MKKKSAIFSLMLLGYINLLGQNIIYVNWAATGQQNGSSWADAFPSLQQALTAAAYGDQIWIAEGTYYPTEDTNRAVSFLLKNGVGIYGGFGGSEQNLLERNPDLHPVTLSGNIGDPGSEEDNSLHVLVGVGLDSTTVLDWLTICDGHSLQVFDTPRDGYGAGLLLIAAPDPGNNSKPVIRNCIFFSNHGGASGGAVSVLDVDPLDWWGAYGKINPYFESCTFIDNKAFMEAGALYKRGETAEGDTFKVVDCRFINNYAFYIWGGAVYLKETYGSAMMFDNCVFDKNYTQGGLGGGICLSADTPDGYSCTLIAQNCIFRENSAPGGGAIMINGLVFIAAYIEFNLFVKGCIFEKNEARTSTGGSIEADIHFGQVLHADIIDCEFNNNFANSYYDVGLLFDDSAQIYSHIDNCRFFNFDHDQNSNDYALGTGGYRGHTRINNCVFANNACAIFTGSGANSRITTEVTNCTFYNNGRLPFGKHWYPEYETGDSVYNRMNFKNCIIWEEKADQKDIFYNYAGLVPRNNKMFTVEYCSFNDIDTTQIQNYHTLFGDSVYINVYPMFQDPLLNAFSIEQCSPVQDRGDNSSVANNLSDISGNERIRFGRVDLGAYEVQDSCFVSNVGDQGFKSRLYLLNNPVPAGGKVGFDWDSRKMGEGLVSVLNASGVEIIRIKMNLMAENWLDLPSSLVPGIYTLRVESEGNELSGLLVVTHH